MQLRASALVQWSARTFGHDVATRVFSPLVADWAREVEAAQSTPARRSAWLRGATAFALCTLSVGTTAAWPRLEDWRHLARSLAVGGGFLALGVAVLLTPFIPWWLDRGAAFLPVLQHLVLIALMFALPFSLLPAALLLGSRVTGPATWRARATLAGAAVAIAALLACWQAWAVPALHSNFNHQMQRARPGVQAAYNAPALRVAALGYRQDAFRGPVERRRRAATTLAWPVTLLFLGWRVGRRWRRPSVAVMVGWWLVPVCIALAYQPAATPFAALHPMGWLQTPEFATAAVWCALGLAIRPRPAATSVGVAGPGAGAAV